ncbi:MAG: OmpP1/FadL family transporter [Limnohabitans sp.]
MNKNNALRATVLASALLSGAAWATNGMLMEGYGPVGLSMGGAAQAYDNGTAAMMNNPATLQLGANGTRMDFALGVLGPNVRAMGEKSGGTSYVMPAFGWVRKNDQYSYGIGVFGQGGMGTEYANGGPMSLSMGTGAVRSELAVGRVILPVSYAVNDNLALGATLDYSWASLDMRMAASTEQLARMYQGDPANLESFGRARWARLDFSDNSKFTGAAKGAGWTGKLGAVYKLTPELTLGASYQLKTSLSDLRTKSGGASMTVDEMGTIPGKIIVRDFQMPSVIAFGGAYMASPALMLVADVKKIGWKNVMRQFNMTFDSVMMGAMDFAIPQNWKDQTVLSLGGAYRLDDAWTLRAGYSHSTNPIPNATVHPLFPAIVKDHYTAGFGYQISKTLSLDAAVSHAPKVTVNADLLMGAPISHSQTNYQLMLSSRY